MENPDKKELMFSNRALFSITVPLIIDSLLALVAGLVDSAMVSSAGESAVSAISLVDSVNVLFIMIFSAIANGGVVVTAQYIGNKNIKNANESARQLLYAGTIASLVIMAVLLCFIPQILRLIYGSIELSVFENAKTYFFYTLLGYPFVAIGNSCTAILRSMAKNKEALLLCGFINILNVIGNAVLIYGFDMGVAGAAISTTVSRLLWAVIGMAMLHSPNLIVHFEKIYKIKFNWDVLRRVLGIAVANGLESGLFQLGKILISGLVATFGTIAIAANYVASTICNFGWGGLGAFSTMLLTVVGQCMGAGKPDQAVMYTKKILKVSTITAVIVFGSIIIFRNQVVHIFSFGPEALAESAKYTGIAAGLTLLSFYSFSFVPVAAFRAAGDTRYAVVLAVSSMFIFRVALSYLLGGVLKMGLLGVWIGMWADWFCRTLFNLSRLRSGKWLTKKVI